MPPGPGGVPLPVRSVDLPSGEVLRIRPVEPADAEGLAALYEGLGSEDRYRRFFSHYRPSRTFLERMTTVAERGGCGLVATVTSPDGSVRIVGEASFSLLDDGDGELGITVDRERRGWLGPYLLDALVAAAAAMGVPNLQAEILVGNGPMLALVRARGAAVTGHPDRSVVRVAIGTSTPIPVWSGKDARPRVLVELSGSWHGEAPAEHAGLRVMACPGPSSRSARCPALAGLPCPLAAGADVIVVAQPPGKDGGRLARTLLDAHHRLHPGVPVCVEVPAGGEAVGDVPTSARGPDGRDVVALVQRLARRDGGDAGLAEGPTGYHPTGGPEPVGGNIEGLAAVELNEGSSEDRRGREV